jgi:hypothetical protein
MLRNSFVRVRSEYAHPLYSFVEQQTMGIEPKSAAELQASSISVPGDGPRTPELDDAIPRDIATRWWPSRRHSPPVVTAISRRLLAERIHDFPARISPRNKTLLLRPLRGPARHSEKSRSRLHARCKYLEPQQHSRSAEGNLDVSRFTHAST